MYANFKDKFDSDQDLKKLFWRAASTGNKREWECYMKELDKMSPRKEERDNAYDWLMKIPVEQWSRSHFSPRQVVQFW